MKKKIIGIIVLILIAILFWINLSEKEENEIKDKLIIYSPHPFSFIEPLVNKFETEEGIKVEIVSKGTVELLNMIKNEKYYGDIIWGGSLSMLLPEVDCFEKYISTNEEFILEQYKNKSGKITRFTAVPSVIMVNKNLIGNIKMNGFLDLLNPKLKGKIANVNPSKSSSSFEHLINQLYAMGGDSKKGWLYIEKLIKNMNGVVLDRSSEVYEGVVNGKYTVGCTFEEAAASYVRKGAPIEIVYPEEGVVIQPDGLAIIKNSKNLEKSKKFVDFLTSKKVQTLIVKELNRGSVRMDVEESKGLVNSRKKIINVDLEKIIKNKEKILEKYKNYLENYLK